MFGVNPLRAEVMKYLFEHPEGATSGDIARSIETGYRTVLVHLRQLEELGIVLAANASERRIGQRVRYVMNTKAFDQAEAALIGYIKGTQGKAKGPKKSAKADRSKP